MIKLFDGGAWLIQGTEIVKDTPQAGELIQNKYGKTALDKQEAAKNTIAYSILKFSMISFIVYIFVSIVGSLIIWFSTTVNLEIWEIILTSCLGLIIILSSIISFYNLRKTTEFINITNIDKTSYNKLMLFQTFNILSSIIMIFIFVLRFLGIINRN